MDESKPTDTAASASPPPVINPEDFIGRSFLMDKQEDGQQYRGRIVHLIEDHE
jgi:glycine cleavage system aminomethyltransferase T